MQSLYSTKASVFSPYLAAALVTEIVLPQTDPQVDSVSALQLMQAPQMQMP